MPSEYYFLEGQHPPHPMAVDKVLENATLSPVSGAAPIQVLVLQVSLKAEFFKDQRQGSKEAISMPQSPPNQGPGHINGQQ